MPELTGVLVQMQVPMGYRRHKSGIIAGECTNLLVYEMTSVSTLKFEHYLQADLPLWSVLWSCNTIHLEANENMSQSYKVCNKTLRMVYVYITLKLFPVLFLSCSSTDDKGMRQ